MRRWILRPLGWLLGAALLAILLLAGAIRLDQYLLRWRAERLHADIKSLELRKSTYADARRLEDRWFDNAKEKVCRPSWCDLEISLNNTSAQHLEFFLNHPAIVAVYHALDGRDAGASAFIQIRDNVLWGKGISVGIETLETRSDGRPVQYELEGSVGTEPHRWVRTRHPEYEIGGPTACTGCVTGWVKFSPFADPEDVLRLTDLNFACITRWPHCTTQADILPTAWKQLRAEVAEHTEIPPNPCTPVIIRSISRQAQRVELLRAIKVEGEGVVPLMTVRRLPGVGAVRINETQEFQLPAEITGLGHVHTGEQFLLFEDSACGAAPATPENLSAARLGASEGWISPPSSQSLPFGAPDPPRINVH